MRIVFTSIYNKDTKQVYFQAFMNAKIDNGRKFVSSNKLSVHIYKDSPQATRL